MNINTYNIMGTEVNFPYKAYSSQMSMMSRIIESIKNKENALLESPTGTGKTMALLCSTLAWLKNDSKSRDTNNKNIRGKEMELIESCSEAVNDTAKSEQTRNNSNRPTKIIYCTRTHKQISQVVRELSRSPYKNTRMTIISSRKNSCVNNAVLKAPNINDACADKCNPLAMKTESGCFYYRKVSSSTNLPSEPWNVEDMVKKLKKEGICPYFQAREWKEKAELILCPYNYILDPFIRKSTGLNLENAIVVLDEAHNIEGVCRDSASMSISQASLEDCRMQLNVANNSPYKPARVNYNVIINLVSSVYMLVTHLSSKIYFQSEKVENKYWDSGDVMRLMEKVGITAQLLQEVKKELSIIDDIMKMNVTEDMNGPGELLEGQGFSDKGAKIEKVHRNMIDTWILIANKMFKGYDNDYRFVVTEGEEYSEPVAVDRVSKAPPKSPLGEWITVEKRKLKRSMKSNFVLNAWCMNPGLIFEHLQKNARSILLSSGTLAPQNSFQNELNCSFLYSLEAFHVVAQDRVLVSSIGAGPTGQPLTAVFQNVVTFAFQDELGRLLSQCCQIVPHGVLCFLSSFSLLEKLYERWKVTGLLNEMSKHKTVLLEPRSNKDMDEVMREYYDCMDEGVLMLAVYRGKASEGMDFANNAARLVVCVGIPYPSLMDPQISLKKSYNDGLLRMGNKQDGAESGQVGTVVSGSEWYRVQAYRALNQAAGRCIRHQHDWGSILLVDSRFQNGPGYTNGLCRWFRQRLRHYSSWGPLQLEMGTFVDSALAQDQAANQ